MTKIHPEPVEIMAPNAEVPRVDAEASRNTETTRNARANQRPISREVLENLAYTVPKFDGKLEDWLIFRHFYMNRVHTVAQFTDTEKLLFLRDCVVGELGEQVARIGVSGANYSTAWAMIQGKFENKERELKARHMSLLLELPEMQEESPESLYFLIENTRKHLQALRMLHVKIPHDFVVVSLAQKLDPLTQFEWKIAAKDREPTVEEMLDFLKMRLKFLVQIARIVEQKRQRGEEAARCAFCNHPDHYLHQCFRFTEWPIEDRIKWVEDLGLCKKCFRDHYSSQCMFRACYKCGEEHNIILHRDSPLDADPQEVITQRLDHMRINGAIDEGTSDEGISESGESESSQEEKYTFLQDSEFQREQYLEPYDVVIESKLLNGYIREGAYNVNHNAMHLETAVKKEQSRVTHVAASQENGMLPAASVQDQTRKEDQTEVAREGTDQKTHNGEHHDRTCQEDQNVVPADTANKENQIRKSQECIGHNDQNAASFEAVQQEQDVGLHLGACHQNQDELSSEIDDEEEQEVTIICQEVQNMNLHQVGYPEPEYEPQVDVCQQLSDGQELLLPGMVYQQAHYVTSPEAQYITSPDGQYVTPSEAQYVAVPEGQYIVSPEAQYVVPSEAQYVNSPEAQYVVSSEAQYASPETQYASPEAQYITSEAQYAPTEVHYVPPEAQYASTEAQYASPEAQYASTEAQYASPEAQYVPPEVQYAPPEAQYVAPPEVAYQVDTQNVMPHAMAYPQYVVPHEEAYQTVEQSIPTAEIAYQPMQYVCATHVDPYQVEGQMMMPQGVIYQPESYVVPPEEAYQPEEQSLVPGMVYQPVQYMEPQVVDQNQRIGAEAVMYGVQYYSAAQPDNQMILPQQNVMPPHHAIHQQHAIQHQHAIQQQHAIQHQHAIEQQHAMQHQHIIQQQHVIHQQQHVIQQQHAMQHHQALQQQEAVRQIIHEQTAARREREKRIQQQKRADQAVQQAQDAVRQEPSEPQQEQIEPQQEEKVLQEEQDDANQGQSDDAAGRLNIHAAPFEPNRRVIAAPIRPITSSLNTDAQEFVPQGCVDKNESEIKR